MCSGSNSSDALEERVAPHLNPPGRADGVTVGAVDKDARVVGPVDPRTESAEVREDVPDFLRGSRDGAGAVDVGHRFTLRVVDRPTGESATMGA